MNIEDFKRLMSLYGNEIGLVFTEEQLDKFFKYMNLLLEWNEKINLTAITEPEEVILKHFIDSLTISKYIEKYNMITLLMQIILLIFLDLKKIFN